MSAVEGADTDPDTKAERYDPVSDDYDLAKDPRCLFGWGPPTCPCAFGHACFRAYGHPGRCRDTGSPTDLKCRTRQRPKNWDTHQRAEACK